MKEWRRDRNNMKATTLKKYLITKRNKLRNRAGEEETKKKMVKIERCREKKTNLKIGKRK